MNWALDHHTPEGSAQVARAAGLTAQQLAGR
jgi:hypothetical protein